ncbi:MAG: hypothetical protein ACRC33_12605 [Gemmataceae bacterium]
MPPDPTKPLAQLNSGMDKVYFTHTSLEGKVMDFGWIQTKPEVKGRELQAMRQLNERLSAESKGYLPRVFDPETDEKASVPQSAVTKKGEAATLGADGGYWVEHVPHLTTFKPVMQKFGVSAKVLNEIPKDGARRENFIASLAVIQKDLPAIAKVVGELTFAIHNGTGQVYLLDLAPGEGGQAGGEDLANNAASGINKLLQAAGVSPDGGASGSGKEEAAEVTPSTSTGPSSEASSSSAAPPPPPPPPQAKK